MQSRLLQHRLKFDFLQQTFEQELRNMKIFSFKHTKQKKYKQLALNLAAIESKHKDALLKEYFNLCKMIYRIASLVDYTWC